MMSCACVSFQKNVFPLNDYPNSDNNEMCETSCANKWSSSVKWQKKHYGTKYEDTHFHFGGVYF